MALSNELLDALERMLLTAGPGALTLQQLRAGFPGIAVSGCDSDDMRGETPFRRGSRYDLFLVDTSSHCWRIIDQPQEAGGVVIARR